MRGIPLMQTVDALIFVLGSNVLVLREQEQESDPQKCPELPSTRRILMLPVADKVFISGSLLL